MIDDKVTIMVSSEEYKKKLLWSILKWCYSISLVGLRKTTLLSDNRTLAEGFPNECYHITPFVDKYGNHIREDGNLDIELHDDIAPVDRFFQGNANTEQTT
jgi:hypothetical protein